MSKQGNVDLLRMIDQGLEHIIISNAREDFETFHNYCFDEKLGQHHVEWDNIIKPPVGVPGSGKHDRVLIEAPRGFGKTTHVARRILFYIGCNHNLRVTYVTGDDDLANSVSDEIGEHIESNERIHRVFPDLKPTRAWSKSAKRIERSLVSKDPTIRACGVFSTGAGGRSDFIVFDDITSFRSSVQHPQLREHLKRIFSDVWMKFLLPDGIAVVICTPWHVNDIVAALEENGNWYLWKRPALDENDESTWPEMWPTEVLRKERLEDEHSFERQKQLKAMSGLDSSFDHNVIEACFISRDRIDPSWPRYVGVDLSASLGGKGSYNCIFCIAVDDRGIKHVDEIFRFRGKPTRTIETLTDIYRRKKFVMAVVENNAFQESLLTFIEEEAPGMPVQGYRTGAQKFDVRQGVPSLHAEMKSGGWVIEYGPEHEDPSHTCETCVLIDELNEFPHGKNTDVVMGMWLSTRAYSLCNVIGDNSGHIYTEDSIEDDDEDVESDDMLIIEETSII